MLVEGLSDRLALETLAKRRGRDLEAEGVSVVPIGGAHAIAAVLARYRNTAAVAGLCDAAEEHHFRRALERAGLGADLTRANMESLGFFVCEEDLEDELVRALGPAAVERIIEAQGESRRFETFRKQLEKRGLSRERQLHGFMWNRKIRYAPLLVGALPLDQVPRPLDLVLRHVATPPCGFT